MIPPDVNENDNILHLISKCVDDLDYGVMVTEAEPLSEPGPKIVYVNAAIEKLTGFSREELLGDNPRILQGPETDQKVLSEISRLLKQAEPFRREVLNYTKTGEKYWIEIDVNPLRNDAGEVTHFLSIQRNIAKRIRSELEFKESVHMNASLRRAMNEHSIVAITDTRGDWTFVNDKFCKITGYTAKELIGYNPRLLNSDYHPASFFADLWKTIAAGDVWQNDIRNRSKSGEIYWVSATIFPIRDSSGQIASYLVIQTDITERQKAQQESERLSLAVEHSVSSVVITDSKGTILYVNPAFEQVSGYTRQEALGQNPRILKSGQHDAEFYREMWNTLDRGEVWSGHMVNRKKDGSLYEEDVTISPVRDISGKNMNYVAVKSDVTERIENERLARRSQRLESIGSLAGGIAHDLNNSLAPVLMSIEVLKMEYPEKTEQLELIETSTQRSAEMIRHLLDFSKGKEGVHNAIPVKYLLNEIQKIISTSFAKNIELTVQIDDKLPMVHGDFTQLSQALLNLCVNARDAMAAGGKLTLEATSQELDRRSASTMTDAQPGQYVVLRVSDTGTGISPEVSDRMFEPFYTTKDPEQGTGLGLSNVVGIVKGHAGFMNFTSKLGHGTTFEVYLPAEQASKQSDPVTDTKIEYRGNGETILFVDDELALRKAGRLVLTKLNFKCLSACDGSDALIQATKHRQKLRAVITDMQMPQMDGLALVKELRQILPDVPVMVCSGLLEKPVKQELTDLKVKVILNKPASFHQMAQGLSQLLAPKRL